MHGRERCLVLNSTGRMHIQHARRQRMHPYHLAWEHLEASREQDAGWLSTLCHKRPLHLDADSIAIVPVASAASATFTSSTATVAIAAVATISISGAASTTSPADVLLERMRVWHVLERSPLPELR